jgi:hypothetical protein
VSTVPLDPDVVVGPAADSRQRRLAAALVQLRSRAADPALLERRIAVGGGLLVAAGVVLVVLGWYGAAHTSRLYLQVPYLISGGLLGVALAVAGGCTYLASWLTRLVHEERARGDAALAVATRAAESLARIEAALAGGAGIVAADHVATPAGRLAHRPSCPTVAGRQDLRRVDPDRDGLARCRMCDREPAGAARSQPLSSPAPPE